MALCTFSTFTIIFLNVFASSEWWRYWHIYDFFFPYSKHSDKIDFLSGIVMYHIIKMLYVKTLSLLRWCMWKMLKFFFFIPPHIMKQSYGSEIRDEIMKISAGSLHNLFGIFFIFWVIIWSKIIRMRIVTISKMWILYAIHFRLITHWQFISIQHFLRR